MACTQFNPLRSEVSGESKRCRDCGGSEIAHAWREYEIQTVPHVRYKGRKMGDLTPKEIRILKESWLEKFGQHTLLTNPPNSSFVIPRHLDILNLLEAIKTL